VFAKPSGKKNVNKGLPLLTARSTLIVGGRLPDMAFRSSSITKHSWNLFHRSFLKQGDSGRSAREEAALAAVGPPPKKPPNLTLRSTRFVVLFGPAQRDAKAPYITPCSRLITSDVGTSVPWGGGWAAPAKSRARRGWAEGRKGRFGRMDGSSRQILDRADRRCSFPRRSGRRRAWLIDTALRGA